MKTGRVLAVAIAVLLMIAQTASAQDWQKKKKDGAQPPQPATQQPVAPKAAAPAQGGACVPSGFARLSRNCSADTGGCQRMPEQCNRGFCCP